MHDDCAGFGADDSATSSPKVTGIPPTLRPPRCRESPTGRVFMKPSYVPRGMATRLCEIIDFFSKTETRAPFQVCQAKVSSSQ